MNDFDPNDSAPRADGSLGVRESDASSDASMERARLKVVAERHRYADLRDPETRAREELREVRQSQRALDASTTRGAFIRGIGAVPLDGSNHADAPAPPGVIYTAGAFDRIVDASQADRITLGGMAIPVEVARHMGLIDGSNNLTSKGRDRAGLPAQHAPQAEPQPQQPTEPQEPEPSISEVIDEHIDPAALGRLAFGLLESTEPLTAESAAEILGLEPAEATEVVRSTMDAMAADAARVAADFGIGEEELATLAHRVTSTPEGRNAVYRILQGEAPEIAYREVFTAHMAEVAKQDAFAQRLTAHAAKHVGEHDLGDGTTAQVYERAGELRFRSAALGDVSIREAIRLGIIKPRSAGE